MVRTQIQLTERQARELRRIAAREGVSMAEIIRKAVDDRILERAGEASRENRIRRALDAVGKFRSGVKDVAERHDAYLADAFGKR
jgi:hypothetical protein